MDSVNMRVERQAKIWEYDSGGYYAVDKYADIPGSCVTKTISLAQHFFVDEHGIYYFLDNVIGVAPGRWIDLTITYEVKR